MIWYKRSKMLSKIAFYTFFEPLWINVFHKKRQNVIFKNFGLLWNIVERKVYDWLSRYCKQTLKLIKMSKIDHFIYLNNFGKISPWDTIAKMYKIPDFKDWKYYYELFKISCNNLDWLQIFALTKCSLILISSSLFWLPKLCAPRPLIVRVKHSQPKLCSLAF